MFFRYIILTTISIFVGIFAIIYLHEYHASTFIQITTFFPQLHSLSIHLHSYISRWFSIEKEIKRKSKGKKLFSAEELKRYSDPKNGLYLAILGEVFDVGKGEQHYGPGQSYHFFTGKDASRAFITGEFTEEGLTDNLFGLTPKDLLSLEEWNKFYHKDYKYKGKLIGRYYDSNGKLTQYHHEIKRLIKEAKDSKDDSNKQKLLYPPCNAEWTQDEGSRVWCSSMSGGIQRDWVGVPRQLYEPGSKSYRCACIQESKLNEPGKGNLKEYPDCNPKATSCRVYT